MVLLLFWHAPQKMRWFVLLVSSLIFYSAPGSPHLLVALGVVTMSTFGCALGVGRARREAVRKTFFWLGIGANLAVLICLKYLPFLGDMIGLAIGSGAPAPSTSTALTFGSLGVSFYVLTALSYLIDVYTGVVDPEGHFGHFALHLSFFPKLTQGPIERAGDVLPQLKMATLPDHDQLRTGFLLIGAGLFKKLVLADRLGAYVDPVYDDVTAYSGLVFLIATYLYALQLYFDFSGYTDMARGAARLFNIELTQNFRSPYLSTSVAEFWRRWHISLSRWLLDYIFKPLQLSWRDGKTLGTAAALLVTFVISGVWHGAAWHFVAWGVVHGLYLASSVYYRPVQRGLYARLGIGPSPLLTLWQRFVTFHLVCFAWIFFRANSLSDAWYIIGNLTAGYRGSRWIFFSRGYGELGIVVLAFLVIGPLRAALVRRDAYAELLARPAWVRWSAYYALIVSIVLLGTYGHSRFLYAQF
jgi:D-alanyl-lipoteichoic acid acyltransferase DltB (MBOAT superfamily)